MKARVLLFGPLAEALSAEWVHVEVAGSSLREISEALQNEHPDLKPLIASCRWARNQHFVDLDETFGVADELALIPPVAGG